MKVIVDTDKLPCKKDENCLKCPFYDSEVVCNIPNTLETLFPKQKTGHWIITNRKYELKDKDNTFVGMYHKCSKCGFDEARGGEFCLNCGAYMGGKE